MCAAPGAVDEADARFRGVFRDGSAAVGSGSGVTRLVEGNAASSKAALLFGTLGACTDCRSFRLTRMIELGAIETFEADASPAQLSSEDALGNDSDRQRNVCGSCGR